MEPASETDLAAALQALSDGQPGAVARLMPILYTRLRAMAQDQLQRENAGHTLQPTALVHEAYLRLVDQRNTNWQSEGHFFAIAAQTMRRVLTDHARARGREKRGGAWERVPLTGLTPSARTPEVDLLALDEAMVRLAEDDPVAARIVEMRFFAGMEFAAIAQVLGIADRTVRRHWVYAKAWLTRELLRDGAEPAPDRAEK